MASVSFSNTLCNPTPFPVNIEYEPGINLSLNPFGNLELQSIEQVRDFKPGTPGYQAVKEELDFYGVFLLDPNRSYDVQALTAIKASINKKNAAYQSAVDRMRDNLAQTRGSYNEEDLEEQIRRASYTKIREEVKKLREQEKYYQKIVGNIEEVTLSRPQLDPERTVFVMDPPTEFPSVAAMNFFLKENPAIRKEHNALLKTTKKTEEATNEANL